jgi:hypothetical protein
LLLVVTVSAGAVVGAGASLELDITGLPVIEIADMLTTGEELIVLFKSILIVLLYVFSS